MSISDFFTFQEILTLSAKEYLSRIGDLKIQKLLGKITYSIFMKIPTVFDSYF